MKPRPLKVLVRIRKKSDILVAFSRAIGRINKRQKDFKIAGQFYQDLLSATTEGVANVIAHAGGLKGGRPVIFRISLASRHIEIRIQDHGPGFDLKNVPLPDFKRLDESGRGIFMMRQLMDHVSYVRRRRGNELLLRRALITQDRSTRSLDLLHEISDAILESKNVEEVYQIVLDKAADVFGVEKASILLYEPAENVLQVVAGRGLSPRVIRQTRLKPGEGIAGYVYRHAKPFLIENIEKNRLSLVGKKKYKSKSFISAPMICSPMKMGQETIGVINMTDKRDGRPFNSRDLGLLTTIANQVTAFMHMARLAREAKVSEMLKRELTLARKIQEGFLPTTPPEIPGFEMKGWLKAAQFVGGDYYDFIVAGDYLFVVIADVSGHNIGAAMTMANLRSQLKALLVNEKEPAEILASLNGSLYDDLSRNDQLVTMVLARVSISTGELVIANAGHRHPMMIRDKAVFDLDDREGSNGAFGLGCNEKYSSFRSRIEAGNTLFLYTDGLPDMAQANGKRLGAEGLRQMVMKAYAPSVNLFLEQLWDACRGFRKMKPFHDDITVAAVHRHLAVC